MSPHWHYATLEVIPEDGRVAPTIGPEVGLTREAAHAEIQGILDRLAREAPYTAKLAETWRRGAADDWVYIGGMSLTIYECAGDCRASTQHLLDDYADTLRKAGLPNVGVVRLPADWTL